MTERQIPIDQDKQQAVLFRLSVHHAGGQPYEGKARARLVRKGETIALRKAEHSPFYQAHVAPGAYQLEVSAPKLVAPRRRVEVGPQNKTAAVHLGQKGWPYYHFGENAVPFAPPEDLLALAFPLQQPDPETAQKLAAQIAERLPLEPYPLQEGDQEREEKGQRPAKKRDDFITADGAIWLFRFTEKATPELRRETAVEIRDLIDQEVRVGVPVDLRPGQVKVMDNQFVVRFRDHVEADQIEALVEKAEGRILRRFVQSPNARLVEFPAGDYAQHLETIEKWYEQDLLVYGEPDLMAQIVDDVFPDDAPDDPTYGTQDNLTLQQVDVAWRILNAVDPNRTLGSPNVYVATLDRGVDLDHPDIGGNLTDGTPQIARCYDFSGLRECTVAGYAPDTDHGMGVYGIIAARTDNDEDIAGIAPNTHQIGMERPSLTSANYPDVLLWAAGFETENDSSGWPAEPLSPGADIISCSHGSNGLALSGIMDDTFQELANNGRGGLGTLVVYSAGNSNTAITGFRTWAAHPNTMAIANSAQPDGTGVERKVGTSNFGPEIDVCAQGAGAPSLDASGGEQTFGGTSAAAPTVAAIAALMLSVDATLTWADLRDRLRDTAVQIDAANTDPVGQWSGGFSQWYGFGRVHAANAVCGAEPAVTLTTPSLTFNDVPEGETTVRAAHFAVESCLPVTLEIVSGPSAGFDTPLGTSDELDVAADRSPRDARIWIGYTGSTDGDTASGSVTIRWTETGQEWVIPISANTIQRPTVAAVLALDQSGSMESDAGDGRRRIDVLKEAAPVFVDLLREDDGIGVVRFDHDAYPGVSVDAAGPVPFGAGRIAAKGAISGLTPNPAGYTSIGDGIDLARSELDAPAAAGYDERAMVVLTDGKENRAQYIADIAHLIDDRVFGIGLGKAEHINPAALTALTNGTGGYVLMTGALDADDYFVLQKYYLQILAGVTNADIVLDPEGWVGPGHQHRIAFRLNETDITTDVILLTGNAPPNTFRFAVETPGGAVIDPGTAASTPGITYGVGSNTLFYRITLPAPVSGAEERAGTWHVLLKLDEKYYKRYLAGLDNDPEALHSAQTHGVRYNLNVHTTSNLRMRARLVQDSNEPGAELTLRAVLEEYGLPLADRATVRAELTRPDGTTASIPLHEIEPGVFEAVSLALLSGVYRFRVLASGHTLRGRSFTREQIVTGAVWPGGDDPFPTTEDDPKERDRRLCRLLACLLKDEGIRRFLKERGIDVRSAYRCLKDFCRERQRPERPPVAKVPAEIHELAVKLLAEPQLRQAVTRIVEESEVQW